MINDLKNILSDPESCFLEIDVDEAGGYIFSPGYPGNYPDNSECIWILTAPQGFIIHVTVLNASIQEDPLCIADALGVRQFCLISSCFQLMYDLEKSHLHFQIFDGSINEEDPTGNLLWSFCSNLTQPQSFASSGTSLSIGFHSDGSGNAAGFRILFQRGKNICFS